MRNLSEQNLLIIVTNNYYLRPRYKLTLCTILMKSKSLHNNDYLDFFHFGLIGSEKSYHIQIVTLATNKFT